MTAGSLIDCTIVVAVDDTLYLYPVTQSDDDSVQEILTDELVKVSVWIVTPSGLAGIPGEYLSIIALLKILLQW